MIPFRQGPEPGVKAPAGGGPDFGQYESGLIHIHLGG